MIRHALLSSVALVPLMALCAACGAPPPPAEPAASAEPAAPQAAAQPAEPAAPQAAAQPAEPTKPAEAPKQLEPVVVIKDAGLATPESVLYDEANDVYLVSNIQGAPGTADNNGFISKVSPEGKVLEAKWIEGGKKGVKLDAPKGLAIVGDTLYVSDLSVVRMFELKTGKPKGEIKLQGATFVNDLAATSDGKIWVTDSGIKITDKGIEPTKSDSIWLIEKGKAKNVAKGEELGHPNGVAVVNSAVWVVSFGSGELYRIDDQGKRQDVQKVQGMLDGLVAAGDTVLFSSWDGNTVYRGKPGGKFESFLADVKAPADIGFDAKRGRLLVPLFKDNAVAVYEVK